MVTTDRSEAPRRQQATAAARHPHPTAVLDPGDYLRILSKRRWSVLAVFLLIALPALWLTLTSESVYEARARVRVGLPIPEVAESAVGEESRPVTDYAELLRSRTVARRTLEELDVTSPARFEPDPPSLTGLGRVFGLMNATPAAAAGPAGADDSVQGAVPVDLLLANLAIAPVPQSSLIDVTVSATDPELAAALANGVVRHAIRQELELRFAATQQAALWLGQRLGDQRERLGASESALQHYKEQENAIAVEDRQNIVVQKLSDLNAAVTRAKTERIAKEERYKRVQALQSDPEALDTLPGVLSSPYIQSLKADLAELLRRRTQLSEEYGELHPEMVTLGTSIATARTRLDTELAKAAESMRNEYLAAAAEERSLMAALEAQKKEALELNRKGVEYAALEREAEGNRELYERLLQQTKEADLSSELKASPIAVIDGAEPPGAPARTARLRNAAASILGGLCAAMAFGLLLEFLDKRVKSPDQLRELGLTHLGYVPLLGTNDQAPLVTGPVEPRFREAFRRVRANLMLKTSAEEAKAIVITSTMPREGKTLLGTNLALALEQSGARVVLVDADLRRSRVHAVLGIDHGPGLAAVLAGTQTLDAALRRAPGTRLSVLPAGAHPPNPPELLSSDRFRDLLATLKSRFDWILIDSPPIMPVADAALLAQEVTGILFVVGAEMASIDTIREATDQLTASGSPLLGAVLNRVDVDGQGFYYSKYYNPEYESYYV